MTTVTKQFNTTCILVLEKKVSANMIRNNRVEGPIAIVEESNNIERPTPPPPTASLVIIRRGHILKESNNTERPSPLFIYEGAEFFSKF